VIETLRGLPDGLAAEGFLFSMIPMESLRRGGLWIGNRDAAGAFCPASLLLLLSHWLSPGLAGLVLQLRGRT